MTGVLLALGLLVAGALGALTAARSPRWSARLGAAGAVGAAAAGLPAALAVLGGAPSPSLRLPWSLPFATLHLGLDRLSAFFLLPVLGISAVAAVYGVGYLRPEAGHRGQAALWAFYDLLVAAMTLVLVARGVVPFLLAWEGMALTSFFLVTHEAGRAGPAGEAASEAGVIYLVATHLGTAFLLVLFLVLGRGHAALDLDAFARVARPGAGGLFLLALVGFGSKAGLAPLHVWLPEAHPVAPSHVSAVMSGAMTATGIYGLLRVLAFLGPPPAWWGELLLGVGVLSGILGALFALAEADLKRILAYSTVEHAGIVAFGLGLGLLGQHAHLPLLAALGYAGALLHVVNHALFKSLLFLGAGAVSRAAGTLRLEGLGGLGRRLPLTAGLFLLGSVAIAGLPPLNGFTSELLLYLGAFHGAATAPTATAGLLAAAAAALALVGGLAVAAFARVFGIAFSGEPRTAAAAAAREVDRTLWGAMGVLAAGCLAAAGLAWLALPALAPLVADLTGLDPGPALAGGAAALARVAAIEGVVLAIAALLAALRLVLLRRREVSRAPTWGCGYAAPDPRMQYTASSFAEPLTSLFAPALRLRRTVSPPAGHFPTEASLATATTDPARAGLYRPIHGAVVRVATWLRPFQSGRVQLYVLYLAVTVLVLWLAVLGR